MNIGTKLSKHVLGMKFMRKTKDQVDKDRVERKHREHFAPDLKAEIDVDIVTERKITGLIEELPSYNQCEKYIFGRQSFGGFNPVVEYNVKKGIWKPSHAEGADQEAVDPEDNGHPELIGETDIPDEEMAKTYGSIIGTLAKRFLNKKDRNKHDQKSKVGENQEGRGKGKQKGNWNRNKHHPDGEEQRRNWNRNKHPADGEKQKCNWNKNKHVEGDVQNRNWHKKKHQADEGNQKRGWKKNYQNDIGKQESQSDGRHKEKNWNQGGKKGWKRGRDRVDGNDGNVASSSKGFFNRNKKNNESGPPQKKRKFMKPSDD